MKRGHLFLMGPVAGLALLAAGLLLNGSISSSRSSLIAPRSSAVPLSHVPTLSPSSPPAPLRPSKEPLPSAPPVLTHGAAADRARAINAYRNYRTAVATEDEVAPSLPPASSKERAVWLDLANAELAAATDDFDLTVARKIVDSLGRNP